MQRTGHTNIADSLRRELAGGRYRAGEPLPSVRELQGRFGAAEYAVRRALHALRDEGLVSIVRHVGALATDKASLAWKGHVAFVHASTTGSFFLHRLADRISNRLETAGWMFHQVFLVPAGDAIADTGPLLRHIAGGLDLAIVMSEFRQIDDLDRAGVPYIVIGGGASDFPNARAVVRTERSECFANLIAAIRARRLKTLAEVDFERRTNRHFIGQLVAAGIEVRHLMCRFDKDGEHSLGNIAALGRRAVADFLDKSRTLRRPTDAILFNDDYLAIGGIEAILEAGLRIPEDIRVVAYSNKGNEPVFGRSLARIENDPAADADAVADYVLALLEGRRATAPRLRLRFVPGESL